MSKLISHQTTETLPSGTTITTLHLTPEARAGLSTGGARIPADAPNALATRSPSMLTVHDLLMRQSIAAAVLYAGTAAAMVLASLGVSPVFCAALPAAMFGGPSILWAWRNLRALKRRRAARGGAP